MRELWPSFLSSHDSFATNRSQISARGHRCGDQACEAGRWALALARSVPRLDSYQFHDIYICGVGRFVIRGRFVPLTVFVTGISQSRHLSRVKSSSSSVEVYKSTFGIHHCTTATFTFLTQLFYQQSYYHHERRYQRQSAYGRQLWRQSR